MRKLGNLEKALADLDRAVMFEPYYLSADLDRIDILLQMKERERAEKEFSDLKNKVEETKHLRAEGSEVYQSKYQKQMIEFYGALFRHLDDILNGPDSAEKME